MADTASSSIPFPSVSSQTEYVPSVLKPGPPIPMNKTQFYDLIRTLKLSKERAETMCSIFQRHRFVDYTVTIKDIRMNMGKDFIPFIEVDDQNQNLVYIRDIESVFLFLNYEHDRNEWRLFLDSNIESK